MTATDEQVKCRCGLGMALTAGGGRYCPNCDDVQPQEPFGIARRKTPNDIRFEMSWLRTINDEYVDNTQNKEVGSTNSEEDASEEGGQDDQE